MIWKSFLPDVVIPETPLGEFLMSKMEVFADSVALIELESGQRMTFKELRDQALEYTKVLWKAGLRKGNIVGLILPFEMRYAPLIVAIVNCGAVIFGTKLLYKASIYSQLAAMKPILVITTDDRFTEMASELDKEVPSMKQCKSFTQLKDLQPESLRSEGNDMPCYGAIDVHKDAVIVFQSSGTTGTPKGIVTTHYGMLSALTLISSTFRSLPGDISACTMNIIHVQSLLVFFCNLAAGNTSGICSRMSAQAFYDYISKYKITVAAVTNVDSLRKIMEMDIPGHCDMSSLHRIMIAGTRFPAELIEQVSTKFGVLVGMFYGMTECPSIAATLSKETPSNSVGFLAANVTAKIIDIATSDELGVKQKGELCVRSPHVMKGYFLQHGKNPVGVVDGWLHTGDLAYFDQKGFLYVVGRIKDVIKMQPGNVTVMPAEFEEILIRHPKISDVVVAGVPHPEFGEAPKAFLVKKDATLAEEEVLEFFKSQVEGITTLQGGVEFVDFIPKTEIGKPLRRSLVEQSVTKS